MSDELERFLTKLDLKLNNRDLLLISLTHRSFGAQNNERLEFLGDSILGAVISTYLYENFPRLDEGDLSRFRSRLVREETLAELADTIGMKDILRLGHGELKSGGFNRPSILADAFEAFIGAIFIDSGYKFTRDFLLKLYRKMLSQPPEADELKDGKTRLQEYLQAQKLKLPEYTTVYEQTDHPQKFTVLCSVAELALKATASSHSIRTAEQKAAEQILDRLNMV